MKCEHSADEELKVQKQKIYNGVDKQYFLLFRSQKLLNFIKSRKKVVNFVLALCSQLGSELTQYR